MAKVAKLADKLNGNGPTADVVKDLVPGGDVNILALRERARELERQADELRKLARAVHTGKVLAELKKVLEGKEEDIDLLHAGLLLEGALGTLAHASHNEFREELYAIQRTQGTKAYLDKRDGPFQPEPMGPRSAKGRAARAKKEKE